MRTGSLEPLIDGEPLHCDANFDIACSSHADAGSSDTLRFGRRVHGAV